MFPPLVSSLSLDAYLLRFDHQKYIQIFKNRRKSPVARENRRFRKMIRTFLTTLMTEVLRERLRQAAENEKKSLQNYLQKHQWNILKATGNNLVLIDLVYPRISESLNLSGWGPLLTCLVLKAVKCLTEDETSDINLIDKMCRKYIIKYKCYRRKGLKQMRQDWSTICTCSQKLADTARNAKLIKSVRNFIDEASLQPSGKVSRPCSAPARINRTSDLQKVPVIRRPATVNLSSRKEIERGAKEGRVWFDFSAKRKANYRAPKDLILPMDLSHVSNSSEGMVEKRCVSSENSLMNEGISKLRKGTLRKFDPTLKKLDKAARELRLRKLCGRILTPVQIPRTFSDVTPARRPFRVEPLKLTPATRTPERELELRPLSQIAIRQSTDETSKMRPRENLNIQHAKTSVSDKHWTSDLMPSGLQSDSTKDPTRPAKVSTPISSRHNQGFTSKIKQLLEEAIQMRHIESVAADPLFSNKEFIEAFFKHLKEINSTSEFLQIQNEKEYRDFETADGSKVKFSFLHYCLCRHAVEDNENDKNVQTYLAMKAFNELGCDHDVGDNDYEECWKCAQKSLAMEIAIRFGKHEICNFLLQEGIPYKEEHLSIAVKSRNVELFHQIINCLKENEDWNPQSEWIKHAFYLALVYKAETFVLILKSEGVLDNSRVTCISCLPCFSRR